MKTTPTIRSLPGRAAEPEALIREARRRQRRRYLATGLVALMGVAAVWIGLASGGGSGHPSRPVPRRPTAAVSRPAGGVLPGPIPRSVDATLLTWPDGYVDDLSSGQLSANQQVLQDISAGDYQPLAMVVGSYLVYVGNGTTAVGDDLAGPPRVLASTPFFAPSATPGRLWLESGKGSVLTVRAEAVTGGPPGPAITLPPDTALIAGTDGGLLLWSHSGREPVELWRPGSRRRPLPYSASWAFGFDTSARLVAYGTGCTGRATAPDAAYEPNAGYSACQMLRVFNVLTGRVSSWPAPPGSTGWVPNEFSLVHAIAPGNSFIAAEAAVPSADTDRGRLYVLRLAGPRAGMVAVPGSAGFVLTRTAWSVHGGWLFYQGPGSHLWAYQVTTGQVRASTAPCCQYTVMLTVPSRTG
jgi:hypothetical protein